MNPIETSEIFKARERLLAGQVVAIPTETVYGLAALITSELGLKKIFSLKERPFFDPLIVHVATMKQAMSVVDQWPPVADFLARYFWPGPLTLVLPKAAHINPLITSGLATVAVRYPAHNLTLELIRLAGAPLAAPSANKFGKTSPSTAQHVRDEFSGEDLLILDGGSCEIGLESTVIAFSGDNPEDPDTVEILRPGGVTEEMLSEALKKWFQSVRVITAGPSSASPGNLKHHYMPKIPLVILPPVEQQAGLHETVTIALSPGEKSRIESALALNFKSPREMFLSDDPTLAARELYAEMRTLSESGADLLYVRRNSKRSLGLWVAIWDRLTRAARLELTESL
jgi:L-threonylcarbamoyladenylate synthase